MTVSRQGRIAIATLVLAGAVPTTAAAWIGHRVDVVADHLSVASGVDARLGSVDADLTGTIRLSEVALGELFSAEAIEGSVALDSLLSGELGADEIRVRGPRVSLAVDHNGDSDLARVVRGLGHASGSPAGGRSSSDASPTKPTKVRRIVVASGSLIAHVAGVGEITADDVELVPDGHGVRVLTGAVTARGNAGPLAVELQFQRSAAEVALPQLKFGRVLAVAGAGKIEVADRTLELRDVAVGRLRGSLQADARVVEPGGGSHPLAAELDPKDFAVTLRGDHVPLHAIAPLAPHGVGLDDARATGAFAFRRRSHGGQLAVDVAIDGSLDNVRIDHKSVAPEPIAMSASLRAHGSMTAETLSLTDTTIKVGAAAWSLDGWLRRNGPVAGQLDVTLAKAPCSELMASLPSEIRGPLDGMVLTGSIGAHAHLAIDLDAPAGEGVELTDEILGGCHVDAEPPAADVTQLASTTKHTFPDGTLAQLGHGSPGWVELGKLPAHVAAAFVAAEDGRFWQHGGFDLQQIAKSFEIDLREHRLARGGSTISQQLIKNAFLTQRRSLDRKFQEAVLTWRLEAKLDKKSILERYLNIIELAPHVFGIAAAARHWFDVEPRELTLRQAAFLAAVTSEPATASRRIRHADGLDADSAARIDVILRAMRRDGDISKEQMDAAHTAPMKFATRALH